MNTLRSLIIDDETLARQYLRSCLEDNETIEIIGECSNGREALKVIHEQSPDLIFLDIQMPGVSGLDLIKSIQAELMPMVIFTTAFEQFALDAFDLHAIDYLLKPIDEERLEIAITRAYSHFMSLFNDADKSDNDNKNYKPKLIAAISEIKHISQRNTPKRNECPPPNSDKRRIAIKDANTVTFVEEEKIDWIDAAGDYMCIHVDGMTHIMRSTMKDLVAKLDPSIFKRIHRSTIVNLKKIKKVMPHTKGEYFLHLECDEKIKVSRNYRDVIKAFLSDEF